MKILKIPIIQKKAVKEDKKNKKELMGQIETNR